MSHLANIAYRVGHELRFDGKTETVTFGRAGADTYASRADEPGSAKLEINSFDEAIKALDGLK